MHGRRSIRNVTFLLCSSLEMRSTALPARARTCCDRDFWETSFAWSYRRNNELLSVHCTDRGGESNGGRAVLIFV